MQRARPDPMQAMSRVRRHTSTPWQSEPVLPNSMNPTALAEVRYPMKPKQPKEIETHGSRKYATSTLLASSAGLGWSTISAELRSHGVSETPVIVRQHLEVCFAVAGNENGLVRRTGAGQYQENIPLTGTAWLSPVGVGDNVVSITAPIPKGLHLYLPTTLFSRLRDDFDLPKAPAQSVRYVAGVRDAVIYSTALAIVSAMTTETSVSRMYAEAASLMLAAHIIREYWDNGSVRPIAPASLQVDQMRIRHVLDFISTRLADEITVAELAEVAGLSTFHFARTFARTVGVSPHRYVSRLRLEKAMTEVAAGNLSLAQIALNASFSSQASFTRAFLRATGLTPGEYRRHRR
jgi:AraC family transcriptional regulator